MKKWLTSWETISFSNSSLIIHFRKQKLKYKTYIQQQQPNYFEFSGKTGVLQQQQDEIPYRNWRTEILNWLSAMLSEADFYLFILLIKKG